MDGDTSAPRTPVTNATGIPKPSATRASQDHPHMNAKGKPIDGEVVNGSAEGRARRCPCDHGAW
jgi:hypothetical protein